MAAGRTIGPFARVMASAWRGVPRPAQAMAIPVPFPVQARRATAVRHGDTPPRRRQVCWNECVRRFVGHDRGERAVCRVCDLRA